MKKTLLMLVAASLITVPTYQCVANNGFVITESQPMGRLAKLAVLAGMSAVTAVGIKVFNWYQHKDAVDTLNAKYPQHEDVVPVNLNSDAIVFAQWGLDKYPTISDLCKNKESVLKELKEIRAHGKLYDVKAAIESELHEATTVRDALSSYTTYDKTTDATLASLTSEQLTAYYNAITIKDPAKVADVASPGEFEWSSAYAWKAAYYALGKTQQVTTWIMQKPTITEETKNRFVKVLKGYHRLKILKAIVDNAMKPEVTTLAQQVTKVAPTIVAAPVVQTTTTTHDESDVIGDLKANLKSNPVLAGIAGLGVLAASCFALDYMFN